MSNSSSNTSTMRLSPNWERQNRTKIAQYLSLSADEFRIATNSASGWNWLSLSHKSDYINFFGISILSLITIVCYVRIIPIFIKNSDFLYCTIAILEVIILTLAASGLLNIGH